MGERLLVVVREKCDTDGLPVLGSVVDRRGSGTVQIRLCDGRKGNWGRIRCRADSRNMTDLMHKQMIAVSIFAIW